MPLPVRRVVLMGLGLSVALASAALARVREDFETTVPFNQGGSFRLENRNGSIEIGTWNESRVRSEPRSRPETARGRSKSRR